MFLLLLMGLLQLYYLNQENKKLFHAGILRSSFPDFNSVVTEKNIFVLPDQNKNKKTFSYKADY